MNDGRAWFGDPEVVRQLPFRYRLYAAYCRHLRRPSNLVPGGSFLLRRLAWLNRWLRLADTRRLELRGAVLFIDLSDPRLHTVLEEVRLPSAEARVLAALLSPGDTFLDVGAHHGTFSILAARQVGPTGMIVAVEPQTKLADLIERSLAASPVGSFRVHAVACGDRNAEVDFYIPESATGCAGVHSAFSATARHQRRRVPLRRFDDLMEGVELPGRAVLKLDVEGSEVAFLAGARATIQRFQPLILMEINPASAAAAGGSTADLIRTLIDLGYRRYSELDRLSETLDPDRIDTSIQRNILAWPGTATPCPR